MVKLLIKFSLIQFFDIKTSHENVSNDFYACCRAVGTFARALDCSSSIRQPSLHMSAAAASRDITLVKMLVHVEA